MLLTPPDPITQILLAVPVWLLFEVGILWSRPGEAAFEGELAAVMSGLEASSSTETAPVSPTASCTKAYGPLAP